MPRPADGAPCGCGCGVPVFQNPEAPRKTIYASATCRARAERARLRAALGTPEYNRQNKARAARSFDEEVAAVRTALYGDQRGKPSVEEVRRRMLRGLRQELRCEHCDGRGHEAEACPNRRPGHCSRCGRRGHNAANRACPRRPGRSKRPPK